MNYAAICVLASIFLGGCGTESPESMLASAKDYIAKKDQKAAVLQLKNILQKKPDEPEARFLLGKILLEGGDVVAAEVELRKALDLKYPNDQVIPLLVKAHLALGQFAKVVDEVPKAVMSTPDGKAGLKAALAVAQLSLGKRDRAREAVAEALADNPDHVGALLVKARIGAAAGELESAQRDVEKALAKQPGSAEAQKLLGDILAARDALEPAMAAYRKAVEAQPDMVTAHAAIIGLALQSGKPDEAAAQLAVMKKSAGANPLTIFNEALLAFVKKDFKVARERSQQLLQKAPGNPLALQLAGAVEFNLASYAQAEGFLLKSVQISPDLMTSRRWLAMTYLATGKPSKAAGVIAPVLRKIGNDATMTALAGEIYMQLGDVKKGEEFLQQALKLDPKNPGKRTSLALARFVKGDAESAFSDLAQTSAADTGIVADLALVSAHMRRGDYEKALRAVDVIEKKRPQDPQTFLLRGQVLAAKKDLAGARKSFETALALNPANFQAAASLASLDMSQNLLPAAQQRFESVIAKDPKNAPAMLALAELKIRSRAPADEIIALLGRAISSTPSEAQPRLGLILYYLTIGETKKAASAAQEAIAAIPDNPDILDLLGRTQLASGDTNQALATYAKMAAAMPNSPLPYIRMADAHVAGKDMVSAAQSLRKALEIQPDSVAALRGRVALDVSAGKSQDAVAIARAVQKQRPDQAIGFLLEGDIDASRNSWSTAAGAYRSGLKQVPSSGELAFKLYHALYADGKRGEADKFAERFIKDNPKDSGFRFSLGDYANSRGDYASALAQYRALSEQMPDNPALMNNLAWVMGKLKQPGALEYAEKANKLAPDQPAFMDTLAVLLAEKGETARSIEILGRAVQAAPQQPGIRLNYARILLNANKKVEARRELEELARLGASFPLQAEVSRMLKET